MCHHCGFQTPKLLRWGIDLKLRRGQTGEDGKKIYRLVCPLLFHSLTGQDEKMLVKNGNTDKVLGAHMVGNMQPEVLKALRSL